MFGRIRLVTAETNGQNVNIYMMVIDDQLVFFGSVDEILKQHMFLSLMSVASKNEVQGITDIKINLCYFVLKYNTTYKRVIPRCLNVL